MVFNTLGIKLRAVLWHTNGDEKVDDEAVAVADFRGERRTFRRQEHAAIELGGRKAFALQPGDALDGGGVRHAEPAGDVGRARLAFGFQQVVDQLDIIFEDRRRLGGTRLAEPFGLIGLRRQAEWAPCDARTVFSTISNLRRRRLSASLPFRPRGINAIAI